MDVDVLGLIKLLLKAQAVGTAAEATEGGLGRFLHDRAQIARQFQLTCAVHDVDFHFQDFTAHFRPGKAVDHTDFIAGRMYTGGIADSAEVVGEVFICNGNRLYIILHKRHSGFTAQLTKLTLQHADTALAGIVGDGAANGVFREFQLCFLQTMLLQLLGQQVALGDLQLFLVGVAAQFDQLHTVEERSGNGVGSIGSSDEHDAAEVNRQLHEMVAERAVLLGIQHLKKRGGGIAAGVVCQLVDLVQHQQRIHRPCADECINDTTGHGTDVGLTVTADIRLVTDTAKRETGQLTIHSLGNRDGNGCLTNAGRANEAEDLALGLGIDLMDGDKLQNSLFHLLKAEMVAVKDSAGLGNIGAVAGVLIPRHIKAGIEIVADNRGLGAAEGLLAKTIQLLAELFAHLVRELGIVDLLGVLLQFLVAVIAQFVLQHLHLLAKDHVLLHAGDAGAHLLLHLHLEGDDIHLMGEDLVEELQAFHRMELFQHTLAITVAKIDILRHKISQLAGVAAVQHRGDKLIAEIAHQVLVSTEDGIGLTDQRLHAIGMLAGEVLVYQLDLCLQEGLRLPQTQDTTTLLTLHHHADRGFGGLDDLQNAAQRTHIEKILLLGQSGGNVTLGDKENHTICVHGVVESVDGNLALHIETHGEIGENR